MLLYSFWNQPSENTPECRVEMAFHSRRAQRKQDEAKKTPKEEKRTIKLFANDGRPYNMNQAKVSYKLENGPEKYVLTVQIYKYVITATYRYHSVDKKSKVKKTKQHFSFNINSQKHKFC